MSELRKKKKELKILKQGIFHLGKDDLKLLRAKNKALQIEIKKLEDEQKDKRT